MLNLQKCNRIDLSTHIYINMYNNIKYKWSGCSIEMDIDIGKFNLLSFSISKQHF